MRTWLVKHTNIRMDESNKLSLKSGKWGKKLEEGKRDNFLIIDMSAKPVSNPLKEKTVKPKKDGIERLSKYLNDIKPSLDEKAVYVVNNALAALDGQDLLSQAYERLNEKDNAFKALSNDLEASAAEIRMLRKRTDDDEQKMDEYLANIEKWERESNTEKSKAEYWKDYAAKLESKLLVIESMLNQKQKAKIETTQPLAMVA